MVFGRVVKLRDAANSNTKQIPGSGGKKLTTITVAIEGDIDEVIATLRGMAGSGSVEPPVAVMTAPADTPSESPAVMESEAVAEPATEQPAQPELTVWNASFVHTFWRNLSDTARQAMLRVSRSPNHTQKRAQLMHTLQLSQRALSGSLSSQGHSLNRLKRRRGDVDLPRPLTYDKINDAYVLDPNFAEALRETGLG